MKKLPPARSIKTAIVNLDHCALSKDVIEVLIGLVPSEDELEVIQQALDNAQPGQELAEAEQFLLTLSTVSDLNSRLQLWDFKLDFENLVEQVADPLQDMMHAIAEITSSELFKQVMIVLLEIGSHLNEKRVTAIEIGFLSRVGEIKDTVARQTLLYHIVSIIIEKTSFTSDLYSEFGAISRTSKCDWDSMDHTLLTLEKKCKSSWEYLKQIARSAASTSTAGGKNTKNKLTDFVTTAAEQTIVLKLVKQKVEKRYSSLMKELLMIRDPQFLSQPQSFFKVISDFALEFKTTKQKYEEQKLQKEKRQARLNTAGKKVTQVKNSDVKKATFSKDSAEERRKNHKVKSAESGMLSAIMKQPSSVKKSGGKTVRSRRK